MKAAKDPAGHSRRAARGRSARRVLGLRGRLMLFVSLMAAVTLALVGLLTTQFLPHRYNQHIEARLSSQCELLAGMIDESGEEISRRTPWGLELNAGFWQQVNEAIRAGTLDVRGLCVEVSDESLRTVNYVENLQPCLLHPGAGSGFGGLTAPERDTEEARALRAEVFSSGSLTRILTTSSGSQQMVVGRLAGGGQYAVLVSTSLAQIGEAGVVLKKLLPHIALLMGVFAVAGAWLFSRWFTRPLTELSAAARRMAQGDYSVRVTPHGRDEVGRLAEDFNQMADEVAAASQMQRDLLANVSHDLRTPLTLIKGYAETVRDITGEDAARRTEQLNIIVDETDRLSALVNSVLELSKVSSGAEKPQPVAFDLAQLCEEVAERYEAVCAQNGSRLQLELDGPCPVYADPAMLERVLHNLLGNAMHHLGEDGVFLLRAKRCEGGAVRVEVEDHGPGIPQEELPHLFDRYYRSRSDAGRAGTGLGLSICQAILRGHGSRFGVQSELGKGSVFWFELPPAPKEKP